MGEILAFFALGTWGFLAALGAVIIALIVFAEDDGVKATVTLILGALFLQFIAKYDLVTFAKEQPFTLLLYGGLYVVLGLAWSVIKWAVYVKAQRRSYDRIRREFCTSRRIHQGDNFTPGEKKAWAEHLRSHYSDGRKTFKHYSSSDATIIIPDVTENKAAIIRWMTYWPFSMLYTLLNDPVRRLFEWVYESVGVWLQGMANRAFSGTEKDRLNMDDKAELQRQEEAASYSVDRRR